GATICGHLSLPHRSQMIPIPASVPGTLTARAPSTFALFSTEHPYSFSLSALTGRFGSTLYMSGLAFAGAMQLASTDHTCPVLPSSTTAQATYPPTSTACGSCMQETRQAAAAASIALPP